MAVFGGEGRLGKTVTYFDSAPAGSLVALRVTILGMEPLKYIGRSNVPTFGKALTASYFWFEWCSSYEFRKVLYHTLKVPYSMFCSVFPTLTIDCARIQLPPILFDLSIPVPNILFIAWERIL